MSAFEDLDKRIDYDIEQLRNNSTKLTLSSSVVITPEMITKLKALLEEQNQKAKESESRFIEKCRKKGLSEAEIKVLVKKIKEKSDELANWVVKNESVHKEGKVE